MSCIEGRPNPVLPSYAIVFFALLTFGVTWSLIGIPVVSMAGPLIERGPRSLRRCRRRGRGRHGRPHVHHAVSQPMLVGVAVVVFWLNRKTMFSREVAVTDVIPRSGDIRQ